MDEIELESLAELPPAPEHVVVHRLDPADERVDVLGKGRLEDAVDRHPVSLLLRRQRAAATCQHVHLRTGPDELLGELADVPAETALDHRRVLPGEK